MPIKTFKQACTKLKLDPAKAVPDVSKMPKHLQKSLLAAAMLFIIAEALNDGWKPNWNDNNEYKYYPWFWMNKPGFRFYGSLCDISDTYSTGGSRLCFKTRELSDYAGKTFIKLYKDLMV